MGDLIATMSMALDGFVEDAAGGVDDVFGWNALGVGGPAVSHPALPGPPVLTWNR